MINAIPSNVKTNPGIINTSNVLYSVVGVEVIDVAVTIL